MSDEELTSYVHKLDEIDPTRKLTKSFLSSGKLPSAEVLEGYSNYTDKYSNYDEFMGDKNKVLMDFYDSQRGVMPSQARIKSFQKNHPSISAEDINNWFTNVNKYKEEENKARDEEAGKVRRAREVKEWPLWRDMMASDYEKERYIKDPKSATFGEEAPGFIGSSAGSKADFVAGAAGLAGDLVPGAGALIGPTIRTVGRDIIGHRVIDSPYQKDWSQIGQGALVDYGANLAAWRFANARRMARGAKEGMSPALSQDLKVRGMKQDISDGIKILDSAPKTSFSEWDTAVNAMPESPLKKELQSHLNMARTKGFSEYDNQVLNDIVEHGRLDTELVPNTARQMNESEIQLAGERFNAGRPAAPSRMNEYEKELARVQPLKLKDQIQKGAVIASDALNRKHIGQSVYQVVPHVAGKRPSGLSEETKKPSFNEAKNWYLKNYERDFEMRFDPRRDPNPDPAKIAAYEEYWENKRKKSGEIYDQWEAKAKELSK
jgi:hypothetical protein